jgi:membrane protein implicated in regulation of membrane protease activity
MLKYLRAIAIWLVPPLVVVALPMDEPGLTCLAMIYLYLGGLILAVAFFITFFATRSKPHAASSLILVAILWLLAWQYGFTLRARIHLFVNEGRYLEKIGELSRATTDEERYRICGDDCVAHSKEVVAFHYCHCFLSWPDLVYDRSGALDAPHDELHRIDIYLHRSKRLSKNWYIGYFGD